MRKYHNPYHFVPVKPGSRPDDLSRKEFGLSPMQVTHDRYYPGTLSGRIVCRLTTESPIFIGAGQSRQACAERPGRAEPFELDAKPAIPASTLRGLVSGIAEAASNSALRVLEDEPYSFRQTMEESLSAIGMVIIETDDNGQPMLDEHRHPRCRLRPLTLPTIRVDRDQPARLPSAYTGLFPEPNLKVYIGDKESIRDGRFQYETFCSDKKLFYGWKLMNREWSTRDGQYELPPDGSQHRKGNYLLAQRPLTDEDLKPWEDIPKEARGEYTRGILRVLGCAGRRDIPNTKKHELFIPYPEGAENWETYPILPRAVEQFHDLADMRTEASDEDAESPWPYEPKGSKRNSDSTDRRFRLKDGDLVYFKPARLKEIGEISLSSIWRGRVKTSSQDRATTHTFFEEVDKELLPFNSARDVITIAEQIFGFVDGTGTGELESALALAGRVYFSHGYIQGIREKSSQQWLPDNRGLDQPCLPAVTLKILDSPKPPSPALYFKDSKGSPRHIAKKDLKPGRHHPQGRKLYLHHRLQQDGAEPWRSKFQGNTPQQNLEECRFSQKMEITPLKAGAVFYFHIDFDNLSKRELGLLLYALKPSPDFRHKIGMGKPIGLGRINIEPVGVFPINRSERYTLSGFSAARHGTVLVAPSENPEEWPDAYRMAKGTESGLLNLGELQEAFSKGMDEDIKQALELLGNPNSLRARVHTPLVDAGEEEDEKDTFRWFVANDMGSRSKSDNIKIDPAKTCLEPLTKDSSKIPTLHGLPWAD